MGNAPAMPKNGNKFRNQGKLEKIQEVPIMINNENRRRNKNINKNNNNSKSRNDYQHTASLNNFNSFSEFDETTSCCTSTTTTTNTLNFHFHEDRMQRRRFIKCVLREDIDQLVCYFLIL